MNDHDAHPERDERDPQEPATPTVSRPFDIPENHLDVIVTPGSVDPTRKASLRTTLIAVISMPVFFLLAFTLCYVSATHAPVPHDMAISLAGEPGTTEQLASAIEAEAPSAFDIARTPSAERAVEAVEYRDVVGAVIVDGTEVRAVVASGGGRLAAATVTTLAGRVAEELESSSAPVIDEVAPLPSDDPGGSILFFLVVICTVGAFLSVSGFAQAFPRARLRSMVATAAGAALLVPVLGFAMISVYVDFEATFGTVATVMGIGMIYTFTVGLLATFLTTTLGSASIFAVILVLIAFNFPSVGASVPASMLPGFWQVVHDGWVGSGAFEAMRSVLFFEGHQSGRWLLQLLSWLAGAVALLAAVTLTRARRAAKTPEVEADDGDDEPPVDGAAADADADAATATAAAGAASPEPVADRANARHA
ncbi:hypothetical protein ITJ42_15390 [Clavibacter michiganensis subsp. phaseoli]|uniref:ABC-2 family transporter protein n=1 Tax=Clavibacter phaseoli TaxID=1734031 RepID=A0A8I0SAK1_9MICO|nr:hypothetical protein [Clavibacter phaseoli]MBF4632602.1 hypothetical protein [Clavibacter phaseoli]